MNTLVKIWNLATKARGIMIHHLSLILSALYTTNSHKYFGEAWKAKEYQGNWIHDLIEAKTNLGLQQVWNWVLALSKALSFEPLNVKVIKHSSVVPRGLFFQDNKERVVSEMAIPQLTWVTIMKQDTFNETHSYLIAQQIAQSFNNHHIQHWT